MFMMAQNRDLKNENEKALRRILYRCADVSAAQLEEQTGLSHGTVMNLLREFLERGEIVLCGKTGTSVGRKTYRYCRNGGYRHMCTVSVRRQDSGYRFALQVIDLCGETSDTLYESAQGWSLRNLPDAIGRMMVKHPEISMIMVSSPGVCENGVIAIPDREALDLGTVITETYGIPYVIENDVNVACIGFAADHPQIQNMALIYQGGMKIFGCGIMIGGRLYNGSSHAAGELRYFPFMRYTENRTAAGLLKEQILSVAAVLNPQVIAYSSYTGEEIRIGDELPERIRPQLIRVDDPDRLIDRGMYSIGMHMYIENRGGIQK